MRKQRGANKGWGRFVMKCQGCRCCSLVVYCFFVSGISFCFVVRCEIDTFFGDDDDDGCVSLRRNLYGTVCSWFRQSNRSHQKGL